MLNNTADRVPDQVALAVKRNDVWVKWTYSEYREDVKTVAKAFIKLGLKPFHSVGILGFNAPEWHISAVAAVCAGGLTAGIYTTNSVDATRYWLNTAEPTSWWWKTRSSGRRSTRCGTGYLSCRQWCSTLATPLLLESKVGKLS